MVKECIVTLNNEKVTIVKYGNIDIQFPAIHKEAEKLLVKCENGKYTIVENDYKSKNAPIRKDDTKKKKTTSDENAKVLEKKSENNEQA